MNNILSNFLFEVVVLLTLLTWGGVGWWLVFSYRERISDLEDLLSMKGAPKAPCEKCDMGRGVCWRGCLCNCHSARIEWLNEQYKKLGISQES